MGTHELGEHNKAWNRKGLSALDRPSKAVGNNERVINGVGVSIQQTHILDRSFWQLLRGVGDGGGEESSLQTAFFIPLHSALHLLSFKFFPWGQL